MLMVMMKMMKAVLVGGVLVCVWPALCVCFSRGASSSSCVDMKPGHISAQPPHTHSAVSIHTSRSIYLPLHTLVVSVRSSRVFMGLLLQARSLPGDHVVGGFTLVPPGTHTLSCTSTADTITHSNKLLKRNLSFTWRAPAQPSGDLRFYVTVVHSYFVYWERIRSAVVHDGTRRVYNQSSPNLQIRMISASLTEPAPTHTTAQTTTYTTAGTLAHTEAFKHLHSLTHPSSLFDIHTTTLTPIHTIYTHSQKPPVGAHSYSTTTNPHTSYTLPNKSLTIPNPQTHVDWWLVANILAKHPSQLLNSTLTSSSNSLPLQPLNSILTPNSIPHQPLNSNLTTNSTPLQPLHSILTPTLNSIPLEPLHLTLNPTLNSIPLQPLHSTLTPTLNSIRRQLLHSILTPTLSSTSHQLLHSTLTPTLNLIPFQPLHLNLTPTSSPVPASTYGPTQPPSSTLIPVSGQTTNLNLTSTPNPIRVQPLHSFLTPTSHPASNSNLTLPSHPPSNRNILSTPTSIPVTASIINITLNSASTLNLTSTPTLTSPSVPVTFSITALSGVPTLISILNQTTKPHLTLIPTPTLIPIQNSMHTSNLIAPTLTQNLIPVLNAIPLNTILTQTRISNPTTAPTLTFSLMPVSIPPLTLISVPHSILISTKTQPSILSTTLTQPSPSKIISLSIPSSTSNHTTTSMPSSNLIYTSMPSTPNYTLNSVPSTLNCTTTPNPSPTPNYTSIPSSSPNYTSIQSATPNYTAAPISSTIQTHMLTLTPLHTSKLPLSPHPDPSPALQRSLLNPLPDSEFQDDQSKNEEGLSESSPPPRSREQPGAPEGKGEKPDLVSRQRSLELGLLMMLGLSAGLVMAVAMALRYLQRKHCRRHTAMSLGNQSHGNSSVIRVQECGDLVQVRRIRENSFLLLQAEYNLITAPGT